MGQMHQAVVDLATALGRYRALSDQESAYLEAALFPTYRREHSNRYTPCEDRKLRQLAKRGKTALQMQEHLPHRSEHSIRHRLTALGIRLAKRDRPVRLSCGREA